MASEALRNSSFVYIFGHGEPEHDLYAARWPAETLAKGRLDKLQWWSGKDWGASASSRHPIQQAAGTETSIQPDPKGTGFIEVESQGFGASDIVMLRAQNLEGPWSAPKVIYRPPESDAPDAFVYAGKSHAELKGADLILTYVANGPNDKLATDMSLYFPRFVKVDLPGEQPAK
jgi:hypothetical protein